MAVATTSAAMSMLSKGKQKIDVMIINIHPTNMISFNLFTQAMTLDVISVVICDEHNELIAKKALDEGAYLYLQKPFNKDNIDEAENDVISNEKYKLKRKRGRKNMKETNEGKFQSTAINKIVMQKDCKEWTNDLHAKFMKVVQELGEGRCYPKEILEVIIHDVPDLTWMQVASHLQKCRRNDWRAPEERKHIRQPSSQGSSNDSKKKSTFQKYGIMPQTQRGTNFPISTLNTNQNFARGESSIQQQLYCPQHRVQPSYLNFIDQFNISFFLAQNYAGDGLQQQHRPLFEMLGSQGLQDSIIGNTNYSPALEFDSENHHNISDFSLDLNYNLNVNANKVSDTYVGSVTFNELGVANTNFQQYFGEPNMSNPSSIIGASYVNDVEGSDSNKKENCIVYFDFNNMDYLFHNHGPSSSNI
ncbi:hypothetical protein R3W88_024311 [Solanum pinnatisectum]|uniref:Response regulatory domain-containing protein n=1 Tax=Solanum pinnatisectum TaxID=50273 RepID=A0AAV9M0S7_9SOLN|nr:hypothetical protein R3W88_024311 [Solanum pinnatisectum]